MITRAVLAYILLLAHAFVTAGPFGIISEGNHRQLLTDSKKQSTSALLTLTCSVFCDIDYCFDTEKQNNPADELTRVSWDIQSGSPLWCGRGKWSSQSLPLWNTLALLSDLLIIVVECPDSKADLPSDCLQALVDGLRQRVHAAGLPKGRLVILWNHLATPDELAAWKEHLDESVELSTFLSPDLLQLFFLASGNSFQETLQDVTWDPLPTHRICDLLKNHVEAFASLFHHAFQTKGGLQQGSLLEKQVARSLFPPRLMKETELSPFDLTVGEAVMADLRVVQSKQEEACLDSESPLLDFSSLVDPILDALAKDLDLFSSPQARRMIEGQVSGKLTRLYEQHARSLRDYFGTMYEGLLDENIQNPAHWPEFARIVKTAFAERARDAIPAMAKENGIFHYWKFDYGKAEEGLLQDMLEITELRKPDDDDQLLPEEKEEHRIPKWAEQLAARALMFGVNYLQGWLALQGIRQAALERERNLPKFPCFKSSV